MEHVITGAEIERYLAGLVPPAEAVRDAMEAQARADDFPIVGPVVGRALELLARTCQARRIFELGSGFGYSAYWFARALPAGGELVLSDRSPERARQAEDNLRAAGARCRVRCLVGDGLELLARPEHDGPWDIVFCDVDKEAYPAAAALALAHLRAGGLFICDNALWYGRVADPPDTPATAAVQKMNAWLAERADVTTILPLRDGVSVTVKA